MPEIVVVDVHKRYRRRGAEDVYAIGGLSLTVSSGEFVAIVGPSGCGKSTLLKIIAGLEVADSGTVLVDGSPVTGPSADRGLLFQEYALFPWKTVAENVEFGLRIRGVPTASRVEIVSHYIRACGLTGFETRYPHELSGGMQQRCALARLLANNPAIMLMDEPLASLDAQTKRILQDEISQLLEHEKTMGRPRTVLWVTHSIEEAVYLADRVVVLTARPAIVKHILEVPWSRPRSTELRKHGGFVEAVEFLWGLLREEAERAMALR
jgi:NitT/TauT family transport system ATP-binding protein